MTLEPDQQHTDSAGLCAVTTAAAEMFTAAPRRAAALAYLRQRGIDTGHLPEGWPLGYAPPGWTRLVDGLRGEFGDQALLDSGLARISSRGSLIDTFRDRVIFPVHHSATGGRDRRLDGQVGGFIGRDLSGHPGAPKYLNSRHSALYVKSELLYGLHEGMVAGVEPAQIVAVEGPLDVLAIAARAARDQRIDILPVAGSGTAFTANHARQVAIVARQFQAEVVVAFDADAPGRAAALAAGNRLHLAGADVRIAALPNGNDPASYLAQSRQHPGHTHCGKLRPLAHGPGRERDRGTGRPHAMDRGASGGRPDDRPHAHHIPRQPRRGPDRLDRARRTDEPVNVHERTARRISLCETGKPT